MKLVDTGPYRGTNRREIRRQTNNNYPISNKRCRELNRTQLGGAHERRHALPYQHDQEDPLVIERFPAISPASVEWISLCCG
jgi:hypothetical protein